MPKSVIPAPVVLAPYPHELNSRGTECAGDCPACRWVEEMEKEQELLYLQSRAAWQEQAGSLPAVGVAGG